MQASNKKSKFTPSPPLREKHQIVKTPILIAIEVFVYAIERTIFRSLYGFFDSSIKTVCRIRNIKIMVNFLEKKSYIQRKKKE